MAGIETKCTNDDFVVHWMTSTSVTEVAEKSGLKESTCTQKASTLRSKGVPLKKFARKIGGVDYEALAAKVKSLESDVDKKARLKREAKEAKDEAAAAEGEDTEEAEEAEEAEEDFEDFDEDEEEAA